MTTSLLKGCGLTLNVHIFHITYHKTNSIMYAVISSFDITYDIATADKMDLGILR